MRYRFLDQSDERLIELSELPVQDGIAIAVRTTGYEMEGDEVVELAIADLEGKVLLSQKVKPQNVEDWSDGEASGGIMPADVEDAPELYQFEEEISALFEGASVVVAPHVGFATHLIEASWVTLPRHEGFDLIERFCESHSTEDYLGKPAAVATLQGIADYYGIAFAADSLEAEARAIAQCYVALVKEFAQVRSGKGAAYWEEYERKQEEARKADKQLQARERAQAIKTLRINALMWICAAAIFSNLAVQLSMRGHDASVVVIVAAAAAFFAVKWGRCLYKMHKLRKEA